MYNTSGNTHRSHRQQSRLYCERPFGPVRQQYDGAHTTTSGGINDSTITKQQQSQRDQNNQIQELQQRLEAMQKENQSLKNKIILQNEKIINDGVYEPMEQRQTGWIIKNIANKEIKFKYELTQLTHIDNITSNPHMEREQKAGELIELKHEMKPNDKWSLPIQIVAPLSPGTYIVDFVLLAFMSDQTKVFSISLSIPVFVKSFEERQQHKIQLLHDMGFEPRKLIESLKQWNWDETKTIDWLVTQSDRE